MSEFVNNIIQVQFEPRLHITVEDAEQIFTARLAFYPDSEAQVLIRNARIIRIEKAEKDYLWVEKRKKN